MLPDDCFQLGYVMKPHGFRGELTVFLDVDQPAAYADLASVLVEVNQQLASHAVAQIRVSGSKAILKLQGVDTEEQAKALKGCGLWLPLEVLPPLNDTQFYYHEIVGFAVVDTTRGPLGTVRDVYNLEHQDLLAVDYQSKEVLIPITDEIVRSVDRAARTVAVTLPEGLLEIYLED